MTPTVRWGVLPVLLLSCRAAAELPAIAIIIDDLGNNLEQSLAAVDLPAPVAVGILPFTPYAREVAEAAQASGKEVLLHMPMQPLAAEIDAGPGVLTPAHSSAAIDAALGAALAGLPEAVGISNHMGSQLTQIPELMRWLMQSIAARQGLFFIDSYTTHLSLGLLSARSAGVPALKRDVFLDHEPGALGAEWRRLEHIAAQTGYAVAIAHPHAATLEFLRRRLEDQEGFEIVGLRDLFHRPVRQLSYMESIAEQSGIMPAQLNADW